MVSRVAKDWPTVSIQNTQYSIECEDQVAIGSYKSSSNAWTIRTSFFAMISAILFVYAL